MHLTIEASPIRSSSRVWQLNMLEIVFWWNNFLFLICCVIFVIFFFLLKPSQTTSKMFSDPEVIELFSSIIQLWSWWVVSHSNSPPRRALGRYRHTSSSRQFRNILCWLEILNYCPDAGNGATSLICEAQLSFAAHQKCILWFFSLWWMIKGIWALFSLLFIFLWNRKPRLDSFMFIITWSAQNCEYEWKYTSEIFYS